MMVGTTLIQVQPNLHTSAQKVLAENLGAITSEPPWNSGVTSATTSALMW